MIPGWQSPSATAEMEVSSVLVVKMQMGKCDLSSVVVLTVTPHTVAASNRNSGGPRQP